MDREYLKHLSDTELNSLKFRASGLTTRLIDEFVQEFFNEPMGTKIHIRDHYGLTESANDRATALLISRLRARIEAEHHCKLRAGRDLEGYYIIREEPTYHELVLQEIERRKEKQ